MWMFSMDGLVGVWWGGVTWGCEESYLSQMFRFCKMVITGVENGSPDMIPVAFDKKFDENLNEEPPGFIDLIYLIFFNIGNVGADINPKNCHKWGRMRSPMARFLHAP